MLKNIIAAMLILLLMVSSQVRADEVILANGEKYEGNIVVVDKENELLKFDVVLDSELIGMVISLAKDDMVYIKQDGKYKDLAKREFTEEEKVEMMKPPQAKNTYSDIDRRIRSRTKRIQRKNAQVDFEREVKKQLEHERDMDIKLYELRKRIIDYAEEQNRVPNYYIYDFGY